VEAPISSLIPEGVSYKTLKIIYTLTNVLPSCIYVPHEYVGKDSEVQAIARYPHHSG